VTHEQHLNLRALESRMNQIVIDLHDAARLADKVDVGVATSLRRIAHDLSGLVTRMRGLLPSDIDSQWGDV